MSDVRQVYVRVTRRHVLAEGLRCACAVTGAALALPVWPTLGLAQSGGAPGRKKGESAARPAPAAVIVGLGAEGLPPAVADMRSEILTAVESGDIAELKRAMDLNELKPEFGAPAGADPIDHLRSLSSDGKGASVLADLGRLLEGKWASIPGGRDIENNRMFVWPHFAEVPIAALSPEDQALMAVLVGEDRAKAVLAARRWQGWRLSIGADGVWHMFTQV